MPPRVERFASIENSTIFHGRWEDITPHIPASSVDLIVEDPPYYKVIDAWWDKQWDTPDLFLEWIRTLVAERYRILSKTGSLYIFASPTMARPVANIVSEWFQVLNEIRWIKTSDPTADPSGYNRKQIKENLRSFWSPWESIIFAEHYRSDGYAKGEPGYNAACDNVKSFIFEPLRDYLAGEFRRAGVPLAQADAFCSVASMASRHYFSRSQWWFPLPEYYLAMRDGLREHGRRPAPPWDTFHGYPRVLYEPNGNPEPYLAASYDYLRADYEKLNEEYNARRAGLEELRRPFHATDDLYTDIWYYDHVPAGIIGRHPTQKPLNMIEDMIRTSSRPGQIVADFCMGSGTTAVAARNLDRAFIGGDASRKWTMSACDRLAQIPLFT